VNLLTDLLSDPASSRPAQHVPRARAAEAGREV
jgi:hypothetical protein